MTTEQQPRRRPDLPQPPADVDAALDRVVATLLATMDLAAIALGLRLGWYDAFARRGPLPAPHLAAVTGTDLRYAMEWCEQQAASGLLLVDDEAAARDVRRYALPAALVEVLTDPESPHSMAANVQQLAALLGGLDRLEHAYRTGTGVPWAEHGEEMVRRQAETTRVGFTRLLPGWFAAVPELEAGLRATPGLRILDVGCGLAWSSVGLARHFPEATVDAVDVDPATVELARATVSEAGVADRVSVHLGDAAAVGLAPGYHLVTAFECLHDLPHPVAVLATMRALAAQPDGGQGVVLVADEAAGERFRAPAGRMDRMMYGFSLLSCLPDSMSTPASAALGTVLRPGTVRSLADQAGFGDVDILPVEHRSWRFYRLLPPDPAVD